MTNGLRHRGPDGDGEWHEEDDRAGLVHTRLAILDLTATGAQPMRCRTTERATPRSWIVTNAEIYNFRELRSELESTGEKFSGESDTEVLLRLLELHGKASLPRLAGMFAFAWYDRESGRGLLARDPFGIKPLYYSESDGGVVFASEVRVLRSFMKDPSISASAVRDTLLWGSVPEPATLIDGIAELPAGSYLEWDGTSSEIKRWHDLRFGRSAIPSDPIASTRSALLETVERHLVSDVPVGIFLSGGIDSTALLALAREVLGSDAELRTFSIGFEDPSYDESAIARRTAEHFATRHTEWRITPGEGEAEIEGYMKAMDQPSIDGFNTWCVSSMARREGMKVVLSGLGGDEMFAGYESFRRLPQFETMYRTLGALRPLVAAVLSLAPDGSRWRRLREFLRGPGTPLSAFHVQRGIFTEPEARQIARKLTGIDPGPAGWELDGLPSNPLDRVSFLEMTRYMRNQLLGDSDVFSMANGLELRVPFVDARLFESLAAIPSSVRLARGKRLLLDAVPEIPSWVREQPKRGFGFPFQEWTRERFGELLAGADTISNVPLVTWYRRWALAVLVQAV